MSGVSRRARQDRCLAMIAWLLVCAATSGCGSGGGTVPVSGTITFGGKPPPYGCVVNFLAVGVALPRGKTEGGVPQVANGCGECDASGRFSAVCLSYRRGLLPGRYEVLVSCFIPSDDPLAKPVSVVPKDFKPPALVVPADGGSVRYDVDVPRTDGG